MLVNWLKTKTKTIKGDKWLLFLPIFLSVFGLIMIFDASCVAALKDFNDRFYFLKKQSIWLILGIILFLFFSRYDYHKLKKIALPFFLINVLLLILLFVPGLGKVVMGGKRWLILGPIGFQPAELVKLSLVVYLSSLFENERKRDFLVFLVVIGIILTLLMLEPDFGTTVIVMGTSLCLFFISGGPMKHFLSLLVFGGIVGPFLVLTSEYRKKRLLTFLDISRDIQGDSYHVRQILLALGSGGILGRGLGQSRQKFLFLPEVTTDSIFAIIAEELGFVGATSLIFAFGFLVYRGIKTAILAPDNFGSLLAAGITFFVGFQAVINLSSMVLLVPLTGVPLPFISYGGSSLVILLAGMGIVYNISKNVALFYNISKSSVELKK